MYSGRVTVSNIKQLKKGDRVFCYIHEKGGNIDFEVVDPKDQVIKEALGISDTLYMITGRSFRQNISKISIT